MQLLEPDAVPSYLSAYTELVTTKHVSNRDNGIWKNRNCSTCRKEYGTTHHGHSSGQHDCPLREKKDAAHEFHMNRQERKVNEYRAFGGIIDENSDPATNI
jgi:hypothetical protein